MLRRLFGLFLAMTFIAGLAAAEDGCYTIIVGKNASSDGYVLLGHNEDNARKFVAGMWKVERTEYAADEFVRLQSGGRIPQVPATLSYWWLQMPELDYSDGLVNENGVAVVTNNCPSREDDPVLVDGGIGGPVLRRLVVERVKTAREGVEILGGLIERFGYTASGRSMTICDPDEGWVVAMVNGRHWIARRVPDDEVAMIANTYTIRDVDLSDTKNFLGSPDIVDYAKKRGWYDPSSGTFSFEAAYADRKNRDASGNTHRQWSGLNHVSAEPVPLPEEARLPFSVRPKEKLTVRHLTAVLRDHYEGTPYEKGAGYDTTPAHKRHTSTICAPQTNSSSVFQLRRGMPNDIGIVWWLALWQPCSTPYVPIYFGLESAPGELGYSPDSGASCPFCVVSPEFGPMYQVMADLSAWVDEDYAARIGTVTKAWNELETTSYAAQPAVEAAMKTRLVEHPDIARDILGRHVRGTISTAIDRARTMMSKTNDVHLEVK